MRRALIALLALLTLLLSGCRGGVLVFRGTHSQQDEALLERLSEKYPAMSFTCTGQSEGAVHTVEDENGVQFPAWTAAKGGGDFQVLDYYMEEWLRARGFFDRLEAYLEEQGFGYSYQDYNHYERHFQLELGPLDSPEQRQKAAEALGWAKAEFDSLRQDFEKESGRTDILLYFNGSFTYEGEEHFGSFNLSLREDDVWGRDYDFDDYPAHLDWLIDKIGKTPNID